jgi:adenylate cyclase class IV
MELEVVLRPEQTDVEGKIIAAALLSEFGIDKGQLIGEAYVDLLARQAMARSIADRGSND